jgi:hypothetical protein
MFGLKVKPARAIDMYIIVFEGNGIREARIRDAAKRLVLDPCDIPAVEIFAIPDNPNRRVAARNIQPRYCVEKFP